MDMAENLVNSGGEIEKALGAPQEGGLAKPEVDDSNVDKFESLLSELGKGGAQNLEAVEAVEKAGGAPMTLGDKVLQGMQGLREQIEMKSDAVKQQIQPVKPGESMSMMEMFQTQMAMNNLMVTEDYVGKIVSKSTQTFDTLLKNQ